MNFVKQFSILFILFFVYNNCYSQKIQILRPTVGEYVGGNSIYFIRYSGPYSSSTLINYSTDNGISWKLIDYRGGGGGSGLNTADWKVPNLTSKNCLLKVTQKDDTTNFDITPGNFTIYPVYYDTTSANEIKMWFNNEGISSSDPRTRGQGLYWPRGNSADKGAVFTDGFVFGCYMDDSLIVNGSWYRTGLIPGNINEGQLQSDPTDITFKIWKIRKDWEALPQDSFKSRLEYDYKNWPMSTGAPYEDIDKDGKYNTGIDKPKFYGDETCWFVCNALDTNRGIVYNKSYPIGIEIQCTIYGFNSENFLKDVIFKKYKVINKTDKILKDMIFGYFSDFDLGDASDDFAGGDSTLDLGFGYNANEIDAYYGIPPAVGYQILQGPIVKEKVNDSAYYNDKWFKGSKNLRMTSYSPNFKNYTSFIMDAGTNVQWYNNLQGLKTVNGDTIINPISGEKTVYCLTGDPVTGVGWYEGKGWPVGLSPGDRRLMINSGMFDMQPSDTQEVVYAIILAQGTDRLNSISELKRKANELKEFYYNEVPSGLKSENSPLKNYSLYQNYPNPFNPITTIEFEIPFKEKVEIKFYNLLGEVIEDLVIHEQEAGSYKIKFDGSKLSSGIYFYQLKAGNFIQSKKMILLK